MRRRQQWRPQWWQRRHHQGWAQREELRRLIGRHLSSMPLLAAAAYLCLVWCLATAMRRRKAVVLSKAPLLAYNAGQMLLNLYVTVVIGDALGGRVWGIRVRDTPDIRHAVWLHYLCKVCARAGPAARARR